MFKEVFMLAVAGIASNSASFNSASSASHSSTFFSIWRGSSTTLIWVKLGEHVSTPFKRTILKMLEMVTTYVTIHLLASSANSRSRMAVSIISSMSLVGPPVWTPRQKLTVTRHHGHRVHQQSLCEVPLIFSDLLSDTGRSRKNKMHTTR